MSDNADESVRAGHPGEERDRNHETSSRMRERLALALDAAGTSIWEYDVATGVTSFDAQWMNMLGEHPAPLKISIRRIFARVHPDDRAAALHEVQACLVGRQEGYDQEYRVAHATGGWVWIHSRGRVTDRSTEGRALRMIGTNTDVSRRKTAELELAREVSFLASLNQLTIALLQRRAKAEVLLELAEKSVGLFGATARVEVALLESEELVVRACGGSECSRPARRLTRAEWPRAWQALGLDSSVGPGTKPAAPDATRDATAFFPIRVDTQVLGVLAVKPATGEAGLSQPEQARGMLLAQLAALVIRNADVYEDAVRIAREKAADLEDREQRYRQMVENINQGFYTANARSVFTYCNPAISLVSGVSPDRLLGTSSFRLVAPEDRARIIELYRTWAAGGERHVTTEFRVNKPDGGQIWAEQLTQIIRHADGRVAEYRNFLRDITERKAVAEALRESEERFRSVFDNSPIPIVLFTQIGGTILEVNRAAEATFGFTRAEAVGRNSIDLRLWVDLADRTRYMDLIRQHGSFRGIEMNLRIKDGSVVSLLCSAAVVEIGRQHCLLNSFIDITPQKQAEAALRESELRFRTLADVAPVGIFRTDATGQTTFVNRRWCEISGIAPDQAMDNRWMQAVHPDDRASLAAGWQSAMKDGSPSTIRFRFLRGDGQVTYLVGHSRPLVDTSGHHAGHVGTITDITSLHVAEESRQKAEHQLRQAQKMESLGTLAGGIAHDFNNILTGILGYAELARLDLVPDHPSRQWLAELTSAGRRAQNLVQQILTFGRKHADQMAPMQLAPMLKDALGLLRSSVPAMIDLRATIDPACPPVLADATQIHQIVMNLCTNAFHALPPAGGCIEVKLQPRELASPLEGGTATLVAGRYAVLSVSDNGHGMTPETLERIFEPFFTTKESGKGTGLGLAVVHGIVRSHHGAIVVNSIPGAGTRFEIYLPAIPVLAPDTLRSQAPSCRPSGRNQRILFVDDDPSASPALSRLVQSLGYQVTEFNDPRAAFACFETGPDAFDLIITDLAMPGLPGDQLAVRILALRPAIPIVLISGYLEPGRQERLLALGIRAVLAKPFPLETFGTTLENLLP